VAGAAGRLLRALAKARRSQDKAFEALVGELRWLFPEYTLVLFGSRSRGQAGPTSDYDLAVVAPEPGCLDKPGLASKVLEARTRLGLTLSLDVVVPCPDELGDPLVAKMLEGCRVLHDGAGVSERLPCRPAGGRARTEP